MLENDSKLSVTKRKSFFNSPMTSMSSFSHPSIGSMPASPNIGIVPGSGNGGSGNCLQQRDLTPPSPYQCHMTRGPIGPVGGVVPPHPSHSHSTYDSLGLGYGTRHSPCSPSQTGYQMNGSYCPSNGSATGLLNLNYFDNGKRFIITFFIRSYIARSFRSCGCSWSTTRYVNSVLGKATVTMVLISNFYFRLDSNFSQKKEVLLK